MRVTGDVPGTPLALGAPFVTQPTRSATQREAPHTGGLPFGPAESTRRLTFVGGVSVSAVDVSGGRSAYARDMHTRIRALLLAAMTLVSAVLLAFPALAAAQSDAPAVSMQPSSAAPGALVEISGSGYPRDMTVALRLVTDAGTETLDVAVTQGDGTFTRTLTLPATIAPGAWQLQARAASGQTASYGFDSSAPVVSPGTTSASATPHGNAPGDILVMLVAGVILGLLAIAGLYAWQLYQGAPAQPGMGAASDLIWDTHPDQGAPLLTADEEPFWKNVAPDPGAAKVEISEAVKVDDDPEPVNAPERRAKQGAPASA